MNKSFFVYLFSMVFLLSACGHKMRKFSGMLNPKAFMSISIGMNKGEVVERISEPDIVRGSMTNKFEQVIEIWEYKVESPLATIFDFPQSYWLYFYDNKLVQWCKAGDWETAAHNIQEIRFR